MLKKFSVTGFKNFKETITMDFSDVRDYRFHPECITDGLLNTAIIYGKNAVGKTNFGLALFDIASHLSINGAASVQSDYYLNQYEKEAAYFEYVFIFENDEIVYRYKKKDSLYLLAEHLELNSDVLINYGFTHQDFNDTPRISPMPNLDNVAGKSLLVLYLYSTAIEKSHPLIRMIDFASNMIFIRGHSEKVILDVRKNPSIYYNFIFDHLDEFNELLRAAKINEKVRRIKDPDGETSLYFDATPPMPFFKTASSGTKALHNFFYWYKTAPNVSFMYIDEFDAFYHNELAETIVTMLEKMPHIQKILTSHNTNLLSNRIMRPDCYFILTQDKLTSLANATDRELREGHNLEKLYISGEFNG